MQRTPEDGSSRWSLAALTARVLAADRHPGPAPPNPNRTGITVVASTHRQRGTGYHVWTRGWFPSGEAHAVPDASAVALCGYAPPYIWNGRFRLDLRALSVCPACAAAFRTV
jgi:hypothetical protein